MAIPTLAQMEKVYDMAVSISGDGIRTIIRIVGLL